MNTKFQICLVALVVMFDLTKGQINMTVITKAIGDKASECFDNRMERMKVLGKAMLLIIKGDLTEQSSKLKCQSKCVMQSFGLMDVNGGLQPQTFRALVSLALGQPQTLILKKIVLDRVDCCIAEAKEIPDSCQQSAFVIMCTAKTGIFTVTNLPGVVIETVKSIPSRILGKYNKCANLKAQIASSNTTAVSSNNTVV